MPIHLLSEIRDRSANGIELIRPLVDQALRFVEVEFADLGAPGVLRATDIEVRLLSKPVKEGRWDLMNCDTRCSPPRIEAIAPPAHADVAEGGFSSSYDRLWYLKNLVHECTALFLWSYRPSSPKWSLHDAPKWFVEGLEEYVAIERSVPEARHRYRTQYLPRLASETVQSRFSSVTDKYADGYLIHLFLHEQSSAAGVHRILHRTEPSFWQGLTHCLDRDLDRLYSDWQHWRSRRASNALR